MTTPTAVKIITRPPDRNQALLAEFTKNHLRYDGAPFAGLLSPTSTLIPASAAARLPEDAAAVDRWYEGLLDLYLALLDKDHPSDLLGRIEWGLDPDMRRLQRASARRRDRPRIGRLDCVDLGSDHFVTEVQWKGAGEGWLAAIDRSYRTVFPLDPAHRPFGDLVKAWAGVFAGDGCSVNTGRCGWGDAEQFLNTELARLGTTLAWSDFDAITTMLRRDGDQLLVDHDGQTHPLHHLFLDRLTEVMPVELIDALVTAATAGRVVLDTPPSYLFNQKLPLALPFTPGYEQYFPDTVRRTLIPTIILNPDRPDLEALVPHLRHDDRDTVAHLDSWDAVLDLPEDLRGLLVLKCGSIDQFRNHGGQGVHRLDGSPDQAAATLKVVLDRAVALGEPWVIQPYLGHRWQVPATLMSRPDELTTLDLHAKFGVYLHLSEQAGPPPQVLGGVASLGTTWKVSGASKTPASVDDAGVWHGAFRHDIRVEAGPSPAGGQPHA
ncbi:hypothetical protein ACN27G_29685 [Plantactinospora sp. WMMB334]|uniref:hypothetical protein n=1 Tax=Plantactinospora sp. WMMB334 TaxID=3404119 RepID=UPI003B93B4A4